MFVTSSLFLRRKWSFFKMTKTRAPRADSNHSTQDTLPDALTTALSGHHTSMTKRSNREKLVQEQLNDEKTFKKQWFHMIKKRREKRQKKAKERPKNDDFVWKKNDARNDKKRRWNDIFLHLKDDLNDGNKWKRGKRRQNDENYDFLQNIVVFSSLSSTRVVLIKKFLWV